MAADRGERQRDEHGRFAPGEADEPERTERKPERTTGRREQQISAPSIGPKTVINRPPPEERLARHEQSDVDAMGQDKRRSVVGHSYGPSFAKQATLYGAFVAVVAALVIGFLTIVERIDEPDEVHRNEASWAQPAAPQVEPAPLDSPRNGSPDSGL